MKNYKDFEKEYIVSSDIASLIFSGYYVMIQYESSVSSYDNK